MEQLHIVPKKESVKTSILTHAWHMVSTVVSFSVREKFHAMPIFLSSCHCVHICEVLNKCVLKACAEDRGGRVYMGKQACVHKYLLEWL